MKIKVFLLLVCLTTLVSLNGCQKNDGLQKGKYMTEDNLAWVILQDDYKFIFNRNIATNYDPVGTYNIERDKLILSVSDNEKYIFAIKDGQIVFESSGTVSAMVDKGTVFKSTPETP